MLGPLLDRIEIINVPAYLPVEKMNIAKNYLIPKFEQEYGFTDKHESQEKIYITDASLIEIINHYSGFEAGVRNLRKCIDKVFRKVVAKLERQKITEAEKIVILDTLSESKTDKEEEGAASVGHHLHTQLDE